MSKQKQSQKEHKLLNGNYALLPILFVVCVVPLIMRLYIYDSGLEQFAWFPNRNQEADVFLYYKSVALVVAAAVMAVVLGYSVFKEWKSHKIGRGITASKGSKKNKKAVTEEVVIQKKGPASIFAGTRFENATWIIPLILFGLLAFVSTVFSEYSYYGFNGIYEQFESIWVVLAYCIVAIYTYYFVRTKEDVDIVSKGLFIVLAILAVIGITQLTGNDIWESEFGKSLYVPSELAYLKDGLSFNFSGSGNHQVYLTLYNPNYVGVFAAVVLPICVMLCVGSEKCQKKVAWGVLAVTLFLCALGSGSKAFLLSLIATSLLGIVLYGRKMLKYLPIVLMYGVTILYVGSVYMNYVNVDAVQYVKNALTPVENNYVVKDFIIENDHVRLLYNDMEISMICELGYTEPIFEAWDIEGNKFVSTMDENYIIRFEDERLAGMTVKLYSGDAEYPCIAEINIAGRCYGFAKGNAGYTYINYTFRPDEVERAETAVFTNTDRLFSNRGYLWSRTIPLLKKYIVLGSGADTYSLVFPQCDYIARSNAGYQNQLITKPHSLYLQMAVQYGVVALLCFFAVAGIYAVQTIKLCWKADFKDKYSCLALGLLMGIAGYGIMGISNDSCVALAPLAWVILGLGFAVNKLVKVEEKILVATEVIEANREIE